MTVSEDLLNPILQAMRYQTSAARPGLCFALRPIAVVKIQQLGSSDRRVSCLSSIPLQWWLEIKIHGFDACQGILEVDRARDMHAHSYDQALPYGTGTVRYGVFAAFSMKLNWRVEPCCLRAHPDESTVQDHTPAPWGFILKISHVIACNLRKSVGLTPVGNMAQYGIAHGMCLRFDDQASRTNLSLWPQARVSLGNFRYCHLRPLAYKCREARPSPAAKRMSKNDRDRVPDLR